MAFYSSVEVVADNDALNSLLDRKTRMLLLFPQKRCIRFRNIQYCRSTSNALLLSDDADNDAKTVIWSKSEYLAEGTRQLVSDAYEAITCCNHGNIVKEVYGDKLNVY
ncbi:hypothetical protein GJ496_004049 [Pomphorhynchus laevis]|nr:hypothetical protein GJ496_004049 [Pomphorhynchus laevis]